MDTLIPFNSWELIPHLSTRGLNPLLPTN